MLVAIGVDRKRASVASRERLAAAGEDLAGAGSLLRRARRGGRGLRPLHLLPRRGLRRLGLPVRGGREPGRGAPAALRRPRTSALRPPRRRGLPPSLPRRRQPRVGRHRRAAGPRTGQGGVRPLDGGGNGRQGALHRHRPGPAGRQARPHRDGDRPRRGLLGARLRRPRREGARPARGSPGGGGRSRRDGASLRPAPPRPGNEGRGRQPHPGQRRGAGAGDRRRGPPDRRRSARNSSGPTWRWSPRRSRSRRSSLAAPRRS